MSIAAVWSAVLGALAGAAGGSPARPPAPVVEVEEAVYEFTPAGNGAAPMWCYGSTCLARVGDRVFASGLAKIEGAAPLNNVRWLLFERGVRGWTLAQADRRGRTREPCPLASFADGRLFLSANPTLATDPTKRSGPARPEILQFDAADPKTPPKTLLPTWKGKPPFTEHSYRTFAADGPNRELVLFQNIGTTHSEWAFLGRDGRWTTGRLGWPTRQDTSMSPYKSKHARVNYPNVVVRDRAVHVFGASAYNKWARVKTPELAGRKWGSRWRKLHYTWTPDITRQAFRPWVVVADCLDTGGWMFNGDTWVGPAGDVHVVWFEHPIHWKLARRFPDIKRVFELKYARLHAGRVAARRTLVSARSGTPARFPYGRGMPRLHPTPDGRLFLVYHVMSGHKPSERVHENRLQELRPDGTTGEPVVLAMKHPFSEFFTATPRAGAALSNTLDLFGTRADAPHVMGYARIRIR